MVVDRGAYLPLNVPVNEKENYVAVVLLSQRVQNSVAVPGIQETRLPDGRLQVSVQLRNREERRFQVQANCEFKDEQGFVVIRPRFKPSFARKTPRNPSSLSRSAPGWPVTLFGCARRINQVTRKGNGLY